MLKRRAAFAACIILLVATVTCGYFTAPEDTRRPVLLANGEVIKQPCYVAVDGECVAVVEDEAAAEEVVDRVKDEYKNAATTQVEIQEETSIEKFELENGGDKPEILTANQASKQIVAENSVTVETTEVVEEKVTEEYSTIEEESDDLQPGEVQVCQEGQTGVKKITKRVTKENGTIVDEDVVDQETIRECIPEIIVSGTSGLVPPLDTLRLTSPFGYRWGRQHEGVDFGSPEGSPIYAAGAGTVTWAAFTEGYGNLVKIDHGDGMETYYAHCSRLDVQEGQPVEAGCLIAAVGSTGNSTGPHLHFEVRLNGVAHDPARWLALE